MYWGEKMSKSYGVSGCYSGPNILFKGCCIFIDELVNRPSLQPSADMCLIYEIECLFICDTRIAGSLMAKGFWLIVENFLNYWSVVWVISNLGFTCYENFVPRSNFSFSTRNSRYLLSSDIIDPAVVPLTILCAESFDFSDYSCDTPPPPLG